MESVRELATRLRDAYAGVLGCDADNVAITGSTTDGVNTVLAGLDLRRGDEIITSDEEHPGLLAPLGRAKRLHGVERARGPVRRASRGGEPRTPS